MVLLPNSPSVGAIAPVAAAVLVCASPVALGVPRACAGPRESATAPALANEAKVALRLLGGLLDGVVRDEIERAVTGQQGV